MRKYLMFGCQTSCKPCNIASCCVLGYATWKTVRHVVISAAADRHLSHSDNIIIHVIGYEDKISHLVILLK